MQISPKLSFIESNRFGHLAFGGDRLAIDSRNGSFDLPTSINYGLELAIHRYPLESREESASYSDGGQNASKASDGDRRASHRSFIAAMLGFLLLLSGLLMGGKGGMELILGEGFKTRAAGLAIWLFGSAISIAGMFWFVTSIPE